VYIGEAISGQIATAFARTNTPWNDALRAMGIVGMVLAVLLRLALREPSRKALIQTLQSGVPLATADIDAPSPGTEARRAKRLFAMSIEHVMSLKSFWILTLASGARQFSGNVFGWYMPTYLVGLYPSQTNLLSSYGIIVGTVGSVAVLAGGFICSIYRNYLPTALLITSIGGMISAGFVICMVFSRSLAGGDATSGVHILYGVMSAAYLTAELWLGAFASLLAVLLPPQTKTFCLAIYSCVITLIYSSAPQMIGLSLRHYEAGSQAYLLKTRDILAILIPVGYWVAGVGFLLAVPKVNQDIMLLNDQLQSGDEGLTVAKIGRIRKGLFVAFVCILISFTIALFVTSLVVT
jgi:hypothetical protein